MCLLQFVEMRFSSFFIIFLFYIKGMKAGGDVMRKKKLISFISEAVTIVLLLILGIVALIDGEDCVGGIRGMCSVNDRKDVRVVYCDEDED